MSRIYKLTYIFILLLFPFNLSAQDNEIQVPEGSLLEQIFMTHKTVKEVIKENRPPLAVELETKQIKIETDFKGTELIIYGSAILQEKQKERHLVITVQGNFENYSIQKKSRRFGFWLPGEKHAINNVPGFLYVAASEGAEELALSHYKSLLQNTEYKQNDENKDDSTEENNIFVTPIFGDHNPGQIIHDIKGTEDLWSILQHPIVWGRNGLFRTIINIPVKARTGNYKVETFYYSQNVPLMKTVDYINIGHHGIEAHLYNVANNKPALYGLLCLFISISLGYLAGRFIKF